MLPAADAAKPAGNAAQPAPAPNSMAAMAGKLQRVEAFGNLSVRAPRPTSSPATAAFTFPTPISPTSAGMCGFPGANESKSNGSEAVVNMKTGVATLLAGNTGHVE